MLDGSFGLGATSSSMTPSLRAVLQMSNGRITVPNANPTHPSTGTLEFTRYVDELKCTQYFALLNRKEIMEWVIRPLSWWMGVAVVEKDRINWSPELHSDGDSFRLKCLALGEGSVLGEEGAVQCDSGRDEHCVVRRGRTRQFGHA